MAKIEIKDVSKSYKDGKVKALRDVSFTCPDGKFFCLLGPAGAGKTTAIKLIAGVEAVDGGQILFNGEDFTDMLPRERDIAVAYETYALYPQRTVRENMEFPLQAPVRKAAWSPEKIERRVVEIANLLGIGELLDRLPRQLSGGQRQRVALGRALVRMPRAYLLDEPIAHLDAKLRHRMRGELKRIQIELGITTIYTTPDQLEALSLADEMAVLNQGRIEQIGAPEEVYKRPKNIFVARFVGDPPMNILEARLEGDQFDLQGMGALALSAEQQGRIAAQVNGDHGVLIGIRPKDMRLVSPDAPDVQARGEVRHVQMIGETAVATLTVNTSDVHIKMASASMPKRGEKVGLAFSAANCHFFDRDTSQRLADL